MKLLWLFTVILLVPFQAQAVTQAEDIATTIMLRGYPCGGTAVSNVEEKGDQAGNRVIRATCPNGKRYQVNVGSDGSVKVSPLN